MEAIRDLDLWIWQLDFVFFGAMSELKIVEIIPFFIHTIAGTFTEVSIQYTLSGERLNWFYLLTDGICPKRKIFISSKRAGSGIKAQNFSALQGARKCVKRFLGVLFKSFNIL